MADTWDFESTCFPPSYSEATGQHASFGGGLQFIDFLPELENFRSLVERANKWLQNHPDIEAKTCESVEFRSRKDDFNTEKMTFLEVGKQETFYVRGLRLWVVPRLDQSRPSQQIGYLNLLPEQKDKSSFESLNEVLNRFNSVIHTRPTPGRIITVESVEMKMSNYSGLDPDKTHWSEHGDVSRHFLFIIRIFYEVSESVGEEIGLADFVPYMLEEVNLLSHPKFEPFSCVVNRASQWCTQQDGLRFCNAQSVEVKMKSGVIDTQRMNYTEHGNRNTYYVRILRIAYSKPIDEICPPLRSPPLQLTCKTFIPIQLTSGIFVPEFEGLTETQQRVEAWIKVTGARILSAETIAMRLFTGGEAYEGVEASFTYNHCDMNEYWIFVIRLYLDGLYAEPPPEVLPPIPVTQGCCTIL